MSRSRELCSSSARQLRGPPLEVALLASRIADAGFSYKAGLDKPLQGALQVEGAHHSYPRSRDLAPKCTR